MENINVILAYSDALGCDLLPNSSYKIFALLIFMVKGWLNGIEKAKGL